MRADLLLIAWVTIGGLAVRAGEGPGPPALPLADPEIQQIASEISVERIQRSIFVLASFKTRHTLSDSLPSGDGIGGAASWIRAEFNRAGEASGGRLKVEFDTFDQAPVVPLIPRPVKITNIVATLPGSREASAGRIYVIGAHYDSRATNVLDAAGAAPGADDDASGVAAVLELARVLCQREFPATLVFMAVAGKEQGLAGSTHWARQAKARGLDVEGMLDDDIIGSIRSPEGRIDRHTVRLFAQGVPPVDHPDDKLLSLIRDAGENDSGARALARTVKDLAAVYVPGMKVRLIFRGDRYGRDGDHLPFLDRGYAAVRFTEPAEDYRHQQQDVRVENGVKFGDLPEFVDFAYVADVARVNGTALAGLARAPATPKGVRIETAGRENGTTLSWEPNTEPDLAGYRILWRETTALFWEHAADVGKDVTRRTLADISRDDAVFGVEAFDAAGHVSPAVFPTAGTAP